MNILLQKSRFEISTKRTEITPRDTRSQQRNISQTSAMELGPEETIDAWKVRTTVASIHVNF